MKDTKILWSIIIMLGVAAMILACCGAVVVGGIVISATLPLTSRIVPLPTVIQPLEITPITPLAHPLEDGRALGNMDAPVTVEVFEDFQCPACSHFAQDVEQRLIEEYVTTGYVYLMIRHYPFLDDASQTGESDQAANASMCAGEQDRFWDYRDVLFANMAGENQGAYSDANLLRFAEELGLNMAAFRECFRLNRYEDEITADLELGQEYGVRGVPTIFVNGQAVGDVTTVPTYEELRTAIERALHGDT